MHLFQVLMTKYNVNGAKAQLEDFLRSWFPGGGIHYTPKGLAWRDTWGSLRYSCEFIVQSNKRIIRSARR